jgi:nitroreductase
MAEPIRGTTGPERESGVPSEPRPLLETAVTLALTAPSIHNSQPWRWRIGHDHVEMHADRDRHLTATDPDCRDLVISCGAALQHLHVALAGLGVAADTTRMPDPDNCDHLATVRPRPGRPDPADAALFAALARRRTDRRHYCDLPIPESTLTALTTAAESRGAILHPVVDPATRRRLVAVLEDAAAEQAGIPGYLAELMIWTHRYPGAHDGVPATVVPVPGGQPVERHLRRYPAGRLPAQADPRPDNGVLLVLCTRADDETSRLVAGEAVGAVLLTATRAGLASEPLSQALELAGMRERLRSEVLRVPEQPQLVVRVGRLPEGSAALPPTPRRPLTSVLLPPD